MPIVLFLRIDVVAKAVLVVGGTLRDDADQTQRSASTTGPPEFPGRESTVEAI